ncbi:unnamed protein product [Rhodiola kirilowii]
MASAQQRGMLAAVKYREIEPHVEWMDSETVHVAAPGFKREDLRVQVTSTGNLRVSGRMFDGSKVSRFEKELLIPNDCDATGISAKYENEILQIRLPKITAPSEDSRHPHEPHPQLLDKHFHEPHPQLPTYEPQTQLPGKRSNEPHPQLLDKHFHEPHPQLPTYEPQTQLPDKRSNEPHPQLLDKHFHEPHPQLPTYEPQTQLPDKRSNEPHPQLPDKHFHEPPLPKKHTYELQTQLPDKHSNEPHPQLLDKRTYEPQVQLTDKHHQDHDTSAAAFAKDTIAKTKRVREAGRAGMELEKRKTKVVIVLVVVGALVVGYLYGRIDQAVKDGWRIVQNRS